MAEVLFYHVQNQPLDRVLPQLLEKTVERGWRALVRAGSPERVSALDDALWTYSDESFLAHGTRLDGREAEQPIYLTATDENPNEAKVLFLVDGAMAEDVASFERVVVVFDGADRDAVGAAREQWRRVTGAGHAATYWMQDERGRWAKKA